MFIFASPPAEVVKLVDTPDSKSGWGNTQCGFESHPRYMSIGNPAILVGFFCGVRRRAKCGGRKSEGGIGEKVNCQRSELPTVNRLLQSKLFQQPYQIPLLVVEVDNLAELRFIAVLIKGVQGR